MTTVARVLVDSPLPQLDRLFDYEIPEALADAAQPGVRVKVPLRSAGRVIEGWLVETGEAEPTGRPLSALEDVVSPVPLLPSSLYALARRCADRAAGSAGDILRLAIPKRMVRAEKAWLAGEPPTAPVIAPEVVGRIEATLAAFPGLSEALRAGERLAVDAPPRPAAADALRGAWADLVAGMAVRTLAEGRSALVVVPDHRDQAQVQEALDALGADGAVVPVDARQSGPARFAAYLRLLSPVPCIVLGNRSTVYAPASDVGAVIIWDDGDPLLAEPLSPGVHARDAALVRQELEGSSLVFVGHTRTSDVERLVQLGWVREVAAARRETARVVLSGTQDAGAGVARIPSAAFAAAREGLQTGPVLVQVARPGYAPVLVCAECRTPARCRHCTGPLRARRPGTTPDCAWCGRQAPAWACTSCSSVRLRMASSGSERTADELGRAFPDTRIIVADGEHPVASVEARPALVIATRGAEPPAVGGYRAVLLLDADRMLLAEQLRIGESCLRWWSNAAAMAAPGCPVHLVGVVGPVARALATWSHAAYARQELADRAPLLMPPTVRVASIEGTAADVDRAIADVRAALPHLEPAAVLGPVPIEGGVRALLRVDYAHGLRAAETLRAAVIAAAVRTRRAGREKGPRTTLRVRLDVPELDI